MSRMILGLAIGATAGYMARKMYEQGYFDQAGDDLDKFVSKAKKKTKDVLDKGENQVEYMKDRAETAVDKGKQAMNDISY